MILYIFLEEYLEGVERVFSCGGVIGGKRGRKKGIEERGAVAKTKRENFF